MPLLKLKWKTAVLISLFLFAFAAAQASSEVTGTGNTVRCALPDIPIDQRPGPTDRPTHVTVGLRLLDVTAERSSHADRPSMPLGIPGCFCGV
jgi:hypothetical protein